MFKRWGLLLIILANGLSALDITLAPREIQQGECVLLSVTTTKNIAKTNITFNKKKYPLIKIAKNRYTAIISTDYNAPTGNGTLSIEIAGLKSTLYQKDFTVLIRGGNFRGSTVTVSKKKKKQGVTDWKALRQENRIMGRAFRNLSYKKQWQGKFIRPLKTYVRISSPYGVYRRYQKESGELISTWRHKGIDYSAHIGTFIYAPNDGWVTVSKYMKVHGKTIVIDHGMGVQSIFNHLSERFVRPREFVKKGQCIGRVGNTGLSTGSHLHYGLSVNNKRVNPEQWYQRVF